jgi:hypothetical protein
MAQHDPPDALFHDPRIEECSNALHSRLDALQVRVQEKMTQLGISTDAQTMAYVRYAVGYHVIDPEGRLLRDEAEDAEEYTWQALWHHRVAPDIAEEIAELREIEAGIRKRPSMHAWRQAAAAQHGLAVRRIDSVIAGVVIGTFISPPGAQQAILPRRWQHLLTSMPDAEHGETDTDQGVTG